MAALANPMVVLVKLRLLCVQLVPVKIVPIADATVSPQVEGIRISFCLIQMLLHYLGLCDLSALAHGACYRPQTNSAPGTIKKSPLTSLC
jgi:hypothetical protein